MDRCVKTSAGESRHVVSSERTDMGGRIFLTTSCEAAKATRKSGTTFARIPYALDWLNQRRLALSRRDRVYRSRMTCSHRPVAGQQNREYMEVGRRPTGPWLQEFNNRNRENYAVALPSPAPN